MVYNENERTEKVYLYEAGVIKSICKPFTDAPAIEHTVNRKDPARIMLTDDNTYMICFYLHHSYYELYDVSSWDILDAGDAVDIVWISGYTYAVLQVIHNALDNVKVKHGTIKSSKATLSSIPLNVEVYSNAVLIIVKCTSKYIMF